MYARVSYSALERFEACSMRFLLHRERKRSALPPRYVLKGNSLHAGLGLWIESGGRISVYQGAVWEFERRLREERPAWTKAETVEVLGEVKAGAERTQELLEGRWLDPHSAGALVSEASLFRAYPGWMMEGYIDLMVARGREVWDLKSGRWHADQLVFYDVLVEAVMGFRPDVVGVIEPLGRGLVTVPISDEHRADMRRRIQVYVERVTADDYKFEGYPDECGRCLSKPFCSRWDAARSGSLEA